MTRSDDLTKVFYMEEHEHRASRLLSLGCPEPEVFPCSLLFPCQAPESEILLCLESCTCCGKAIQLRSGQERVDMDKKIWDKDETCLRGNLEEVEKCPKQYQES